MQIELLSISISVCHVILIGATPVSSVAEVGRAWISDTKKSTSNEIQHISRRSQWPPKATSVPTLHGRSNWPSRLKEQPGYTLRGCSTSKESSKQRMVTRPATELTSKGPHLLIRTIEKGKSTSSKDGNRSVAGSSIELQERVSSSRREHGTQSSTTQRTASTSHLQQSISGAQSSTQQSPSSSRPTSYSKPPSLKAAEDIARKARIHYHETKSEYSNRWKAHIDAHQPRPLDLGGREYILQDAEKVVAAKRKHMDTLMQARTSSTAENRPDRSARNNVKALSALLTAGALKAQYQFKKDEIAKERASDLLTHMTAKYGPSHTRTATIRREHKLSIIDAGASYQKRLAQIAAARSVRNAGGRDTDSSDSDTSSNKSM